MVKCYTLNLQYKMSQSDSYNIEILNNFKFYLKPPEVKMN